MRNSLRAAGLFGGQSDDKLRRPFRFRRCARDPSAVHQNDLLDQGQPDSEPSLRAVEGPVDLREEFEDMREGYPAECRPRYP